MKLRRMRLLMKAQRRRQRVVKRMTMKRKKRRPKLNSQEIRRLMKRSL